MAEVNAAELEKTAEAAFGAGFSDTPPAPVVKVVEEPVPEPAKPVAAVAPAVVPEKPQYVRLTKQEWDNTKAANGKVASLESQVAKLLGSVGSMPKAEQIVQQAVDRMRSQTPAGLSVEMSDEDFAELQADFPELAKSTRTTLERIFKKANVKGTADAAPTPAAAAAPAPGVDPDAVNKLVDEALVKKEYTALTKSYPDWAATVGQGMADEAKAELPFRKWLATQPAEYQKDINETQSPAEVKEAIARFRADSTSSTTATPAKPDKGAARRAVIADAVTPRADGNPPPLNPPVSADEAFASGFKTVRRH